MNNCNDWIYKTSYQIEYYYHPFFDSHTFYSPDRKGNIFIDSNNDETPIAFPKIQSEEKFCAFCIGCLNQATPEKLRIIKKNNTIIYEKYPSILKKIEDDEYILFRRQANLFEILNFEFWKKKYNISPLREDKEKIEESFSDPEKRKFLEYLLSIKLKKIHKNIEDLSFEQKKASCQYFYSGFHELFTSGSHYLAGAKSSSELFHSGYISFEEHRICFQQIVQILEEMKKKNPFIRFIAVFQNWLFQAGASFKHWHKQIIGLDYWGRPLEREALCYKKNPTIYSDFAMSIAQQEDLFIIENENAIAYVEIGSKTGCITICSKSKNLRPYEHTTEEINSMSDLIHAILSCFTPLTPYNEEWFYTPFDGDNFKTPWRIMIHFRTNISAGLEYISQYEVNCISAKNLAQTIRNSLEKTKKRVAPNIIYHPKKKNINDILQYQK